MDREREEREEFLQLRKSRFLISHGIKMTTPCLPSTPLPPTHKLQLADPIADHIFLPGNPSTDLSRGTHSCTMWNDPHGLRCWVPPRRGEVKLMRGPSCSSSPRPWHLTTYNLARNGANTEAPPHTQASFPYQELTNKFNKVSLNTPLCSPAPEASVYLTDHSQRVLWVRWEGWPYQNWWRVE